ncbi:MAG: WecB/TagA/CpsF family glycosyltransferase [Lentimicrobiaceae bacterium]|nr:WecB/TagA/CpsF family glycosyltransferase [Lentimicrobiaceae bacterium]MBT7035368.1 WecB/TagA/CpsF family glycosyltransferase [Lentimicrobiaceae bacterium]
MNSRSRIDFFGFNIDNLSMRESLDTINESIRSKNNFQHVALNVGKLVKSRNDPLLRESIQGADMINIDGAGIVYGMRLFGLKPKGRVAGIDLMYNLLSEAERYGFGVYFLGATDDVLYRMVSSFKLRLPKLRIAGFHNGYFKEEDEMSVVNEIASLKPSIVFVGISSPKKEIFIKRNKNKLNARFVMGVGGSFDIFAGKTKRAPLFVQNKGLEWLYRIYQEPRRMWKRYFITNAVYLFLLIRELIVIVLTKVSK